MKIQPERPAKNITVIKGQPGQLNGETSVSWLTANWRPPTKLHQLPDGDVVIEKFPAQESYAAFNLAGDRVPLVVQDGQGSRGLHKEALARLEYKLRQGFLLEQVCPSLYPMRDYVNFGPMVKVQAYGGPKAIPVPPRLDAPCTVAADGEPIGPGHPCTCVVRTVEKRRAAHRAAMRKVEDQVEKQARDRRAEDQAAIAAAVRRGVEEATEIKKGRKP